MDDATLGKLIRDALHNGVCVYFQAPLDARDKSWFVEAYCHRNTSRSKRRFDREKDIDPGLLEAARQVIGEVLSPGQGDWVSSLMSADIAKTEDRGYLELTAAEKETPSEEGGVDDLV